MSCDTTQELRTIRLGGVLGKRFGRVHRLAVDSPAEALRALSVIKAGFREFMENSHKKKKACKSRLFIPHSGGPCGRIEKILFELVV